MYYRESIQNGIIYQDLIRILSNFSLMMIAEAAAEDEYLILVGDGRVSASALNFLIFTGVLLFLPIGIIVSCKH